MIYDYDCNKCGTHFDEITTIKQRDEVCCPKCEEHAERKFTPTALPIKLFPVGYWHHLDSKPIYIKSASHLAEECKKRWTPSNKPWPEMLDGISTPGVPNDVKYDGAENHPTGEELCQKKQRRLDRMVEQVKLAKEKGIVTTSPKSQTLLT